MAVKTITIDETMLEWLDILWFEYKEWNTSYKVDYNDIRVLLKWFIMFAIPIVIWLYLNKEKFLLSICT